MPPVALCRFASVKSKTKIYVENFKQKDYCILRNRLFLLYRALPHSVCINSMCCDLLAFNLKTGRKDLGLCNIFYSVHVRRTDKINSEAAFFSLAKYMAHVDKWFEQYEKANPGVQRTVYLATDDPKVWSEAKTKYGFAILFF